MKINWLRRIALCHVCAFCCTSLTGNAQLSGVFTVGPGGQFPNLTGPGGFFQALNNEPGGSSGLIEIRITGNLCEPGTNFLNGTKLNNFGFSVYPNPGAPLPIIINNCTDINQGLIRLDGVANTTISGLTFINTNTTPANAKPVLEFLNFSNSVIIENNTFRCNDPSTIEGTLMLGSGVHTNAIIRNNTFGDAIGGGITNMPGNAIYANNATDRLQIANNTISNNTNYGIFLNTGNGTVVDGNRIFQTVPKTASGGGILITGGGNLTITNNIIGNGNALGGGNWIQDANDFFGINAVPNTFAPDPLSNTIISGNTIEDVIFNSPGTPSFSGIFCQQGNITLSNNIIRNNTCNANGFIHGLLLSPVNGSTYSVTGNTISGMTNNSTGSSSRVVGIRNQGGGGLSTFTNNSITNCQTLSTNPSTTSPALAGMEIASSNGAFDIYFNTFSEIYNPGLSLTTVTGINTNTFPNTIDIQRNKIFDIRNTGSAGSTIFGMNLQGGNGQVINNYIGITNSGNTNDVSVTGINFSGSSSSAINAIYNSVFINILLNAGATSSTYCFRRPGSAVVNFTNNALVNNSQGGTGKHVALANTRSSSTATGFNGSNYNFLFTRDPLTVAYWNAALEDFPNWITISQKDGNSLTASPPNFNPQVCMDPITGDFILSPAAQENWYFYGNANPVAGITLDQRGIPGIRPDIITNGVPDIGAFELDPPTVDPPNMMVTGITAPGATQDFFFGGQRFASIQWGLGGTLPVLNFAKRFSQPPPGFNGSNPGLKSISNYFEVNATGGSGFTARTTFIWFPNAEGRVSPVSNAAMGQKETGGSWTISPGALFSTTPSPYNTEAITADLFRFSLFTAVDPASTLPVNLLSFKAQKKNNDVVLLWSTAGETDHDHFEVERSLDGIQFNNIAMVPGNNNSSSEKNYSSTDTKALQLPAVKIYYRLKMVSRSGNNTYSNIIQVPLSVMQQEWSWKLNPNPFHDKVTVNLNLPENSLLECSLYSMTGDLLRKKTVRGEKGYSTIEMNGLEKLLKGTYIIQLKKDGQVMTEKMVKF